MISVWIPGRPRTKGSLDQFHRDTPQSRRWRRMMAYALEQARIAQGPASGGERLTQVLGAVAVRAIFYLPVADPITENCGDLDKLARNLLDAGQDAAAYANDVQVVRLFTDKVSAGGGPSGVLVSIWAPTPGELDAWRHEATVERSAALMQQGLTS